jgi:hypothetical protein
MATQIALRPYATVGIALVGASVIAVGPLAPPPPAPNVQTRPVQLVDAWSDLITNTTTNLTNIVDNADTTAISGVFSALLTNPLGVIEALTNVDPTVTTTPGIPLGISVELPPADEISLSNLGAEIATFQGINEVIGQLASDPSNALSTLIEAPAVIANDYLNGADNVNILDGIINIPVVNGILSPLQPLDIDLNLTDLVNALGLGDLSLSSLNLSSLLSQIGLGDLTLGNLFDDLGLGSKTLEDLLGNASLGTVLGDLGLSNLDLGNFGIADILSDLGLSGNVDLGSLDLNTVLDAFGINGTISTGLSGLLQDLGFGTPGTGFLSEGLGTLLASSSLGDPLSGITSDLNSLLSTTLEPLFSAIPGLSTILGTLGINFGSLLTPADLETDLNNAVNVGDLLGGQSIDEDVSSLLTALGVSVPDNLTVGGILTDLGFGSGVDNLTLSGLLGDLGGLDTGVGSLLGNVTLDQLLTDLGLSDSVLSTLPGVLGNLGDLTNLNLDGLLSDLGLGDLADISVNNFGGLITELADAIPQQILASI